ncbi:MAG TPA: DUF1566 domain-containing protein [Dissulfurispiraceae bacterium]|nr:DUF1566 domain-containing protein [Dissulfurispiraceae bacterium]
MPASTFLLIVAFSMFLSVPMISRAAGTIWLQQTGQNTTYSAGDDGALKKGVAWPSPRFTNPDGTTPVTGSVVKDQLTGLMWTQDGNAPGPIACNPAAPREWQQVLDYVACLNSNTYLGHNDWRMPNKRELRSLVNYGAPFNADWLLSQGFTNALNARYWTSTSLPSDLSTLAWEIVLEYGQTSEYDAYKDVDLSYAWPVRGGYGIYAAPSDLPQTGQTTSYYAGDDGALRKGAPWPSPRFSNHGNGTITDNLTGLIWTQNGQSSIPAVCTPAVNITWYEALAHVACLNTNNYLGYANWRLPNVNELESLVNSEYGPITDWLSLQGFSNFPDPPSYYWSSTTYANSDDAAWYVDMYIGTVRPYDKDNGLIMQFSVWPVRELCAIIEAKLDGTGTPYSHIQDAYNAVTANGHTIQMQAAIFPEDPVLAHSYSVTLRGGYECGYVSISGWTTIQGKLTISNGIITVENVLIQ